MNISERGLQLIRDSEGCKLQAYPDSKGVATIGTGHTSGVKLGMQCTQEQAEEWLREDVQKAVEAVNRLVSVPLTQGQFDALVSFVFNLGVGNFLGSTLLRRLNVGAYEDAADEFCRWVNCGGRKLPGLVTRRQREAELFRERP